MAKPKFKRHKFEQKKSFFNHFDEIHHQNDTVFSFLFLFLSVVWLEKYSAKQVTRQCPPDPTSGFSTSSHFRSTNAKLQNPAEKNLKHANTPLLKNPHGNQRAWNEPFPQFSQCHNCKITKLKQQLKQRSEAGTLRDHGGGLTASEFLQLGGVQGQLDHVPQRYTQASTQNAPTHPPHPCTQTSLKSKNLGENCGLLPVNPK